MGIQLRYEVKCDEHLKGFEHGGLSFEILEESIRRDLIPGPSFTTGGKTFTIGGEICGNSNSEYVGLFGTVKEIRTDSDRETVSESPSICCAFLPPEADSFIADMEVRASSTLYGLPLRFEDFPLDDVILSPEMLEPIAASTPSTEERTYTLSYCTDSDCGMASGTLGISSDRSVLLRRMLDDLKSYDVNLVLSHFEETMNGFVFTYEGLEVGCDDVYLCYTISSASIYPLVQGGVAA